MFAPFHDAPADPADRLALLRRASLADATSPQDWNTLYLASPDFMR